MNSKQGEIFVSSFLLYLVSDLNINRAGISREKQILIEKKSGCWEIKLDISQKQWTLKNKNVLSQQKKWTLGNKTGHSYIREWTLSSKTGYSNKIVWIYEKISNLTIDIL